MEKPKKRGNWRASTDNIWEGDRNRGNQSRRGEIMMLPYRKSRVSGLLFYDWKYTADGNNAGRTTNAVQLLVFTSSS